MNRYQVTVQLKTYNEYTNEDDHTTLTFAVNAENDNKIISRVFNRIAYVYGDNILSYYVSESHLINRE